MTAGLTTFEQAAAQVAACSTVADTEIAVSRLLYRIEQDPQLVKRPEVVAWLEWAAGWASDLKEQKRRHPLAYARLWAPRCIDCGEWDAAISQWAGPEMVPTGEGMAHRCPECGKVENRTSQRLAIQTVLYSESDRCFVLGGNRTGKSEGVSQVATAVSLGRDHPDVISWCRENGIDLDRVPVRKLPYGGGLIYAVALTSNDSKQYVRPKLSRYMPHDTVYRNWSGNGQADAVHGEAAIVCKSVDQGRRAMQGAASRLNWLDEEPDGNDVNGIIEELDARLTDRDGWMLLSMTPLRGWTPLLESHLRDPRPDVCAVHLDALDNPHVPRHSVIKRLARYGERIRMARQKGTIQALEGAVHPEFDRALHVVPSFEIPESWPRFGSIDFGTRAPFAHLWGALDTRDYVLHIYREHYGADMLIRDHARAIWAAEGCEHCQPPEFGNDVWQDWAALVATQDTGCEHCKGTGRSEPDLHMRWADPEGKDSRGTLAFTYNLPTSTARKDRRASCDALSDLIVPDVAGKPHLIVHDCCHNLIREIENLTWDEKRKGETEVRGDDHAWDALRYMAFGLQRSGWLQPIRDD